MRYQIQGHTYDDIKILGLISKACSNVQLLKMTKKKKLSFKIANFRSRSFYFYFLTIEAEFLNKYEIC
jgi:predicted glycosyltransferase involved in capsule biosynthesis